MKNCLRVAPLVLALFGLSTPAAAVEPAAALQLQWSFGTAQASQAGLKLGFVAQAQSIGAGQPAPALALTGLRWNRGTGVAPMVLGISPDYVHSLYADGAGTGKRAKWPWITAVSIVGGVALASLVSSDDDDQRNTDGTSSNDDERCNIASTNSDGDITIVSESCVP